MKVAILTTVLNMDLYKVTVKTFPAYIDKYYFSGKFGIYGLDSIQMAQKLTNSYGYDYVVLVDEDFIFKDHAVFKNLLNFIKQHEVDVCGVRDGGSINHRLQNPHAVNTFFTILSNKAIESIEFHKLHTHQYIKKGEFSLGRNDLKYNYDEMSLFEPYYCYFFYCLRKNFKFEYLAANSYKDDISSVVLFKNKEIGIHTWYARFYKKDRFHTDRIDNIMEAMNFQNEAHFSRMRLTPPLRLKYLRNILIFLKNRVSKTLKAIF